MIKATGVAKIEGSEIKPQFWGKKSQQTIKF
jgi:hypothetical protein